jgi:hypothetical protein
MGMGDEPTTPSRRELFWATGGLSLVALLVFSPQTLHPTDLVVGRQHGGRNDLTAQFLAMRTFPREALGRGDSPLWNPWILMGQPWIGNPQAAPLYPPNWIAAALGHPAVLSWLLVCHQIWAGLGTYLFCRRLGCRGLTAWWGSSLVVGAPFFVAQMGEGHFNQVCLAAWIPWTFWAYEGWRRRMPAARCWLPICLTAAVCCGHVQEAYYLVLVLSLACGVEALVHLLKGRAFDAVRLLGSWVWIGLLTAGLSAVEVAPIVVHMQQAVRGRSFSLAEIAALSPGWDHLWQLLDPFALGGPDNFEGSGRFYWETLCHFGLLGPLFAAWGMLAGGRRAGVLRWTLVLLFAGLFAFGPHAPVYALCHQLLPGVALFRVPSRMLFLVSVLLASLAAVGAETLWTTTSPRKARTFWGVLGLVALCGWIWCMAAARLPANPPPWQRALGQPSTWGWLATGCLAAWLMTLRQPRAVWLAAMLLVGASTIQLAGVSQALLQTVTVSGLRRDAPLLAWLNSHAPRDYPRILARHEHLSDDEANRFRLCKLCGYEPVPLVRTYDLFDALTGGREIGEQMLGFLPITPQRWNKPLLDLLGVQWLVTDTDAGPLEGWQRIQQGSMAPLVVPRGSSPSEVPFVLYHNPTALPRAFVVGHVDVLRRHEAFSQRPKQWDPRATVLLDRDVLPAGERAEFRAAKIVEYGTDRVVLEARLSAPGYLVLTDLWYPGWKARDDQGRELPVLRANHALRAVPLPAGEHRVTMTFAPPLWGLAAGITVLSLVLWGSGIWLTFRRVAAVDGAPPAATPAPPQVQP